MEVCMETQRFKECRLLQHDGRQRALAYVGISSSATMPDGKPWGGQVVALVDDWDNTYYNRLTPQHRTEIAAHFGHHFISFLNAGDRISDMRRKLYGAEAFGPAYILSLDMPWGERYFIMEVIDNLPGEAERQGGRTAYLAFLGRTSWEEEDLIVLAEYDYAHHVQSQTGQ
ncbi:g8411 [Coccomyxa viridis]|uniref:G8411 protein n=1 Tax=Coccomyxa viridis TaxID=1274662 RepID=A0ABP1G4E4_9CHLO